MTKRLEDDGKTYRYPSVTRARKERTLTLAHRADANMEQNTCCQRLSDYRLQCHCCEIHISYGVTLPITDSVYLIKLILKESTLIITYLVLFPKELADSLKRNTPLFASSGWPRYLNQIREVCRKGAVFQFPGSGIQAWFTIDIWFMVLQLHLSTNLYKISIYGF